LGYGRLCHSLEAFLGSIGLPTSPQSARHRISGYVRGGFAYLSPYVLTPGLPSPGLGYLPASPHRLPTTGLGRALRRFPRRVHDFGRLALPGSALARHCRYGNINPLSIDYACRPRLRSRLTQGGLAWPWNPWSSGGHTTLPYPSIRLDACAPSYQYECHGFGGMLEPRYIVGAESLDQ
jgi:hypothetical protein